MDYRIVIFIFDQFILDSPQGSVEEQVSQLQRKLVSTREQYETEMKVLEYTLTETHALETNTLRAQIEAELDDTFKQRKEELELEFEQTTKAFKKTSEHKFVEELQKV